MNKISYNDTLNVNNVFLELREARASGDQGKIDNAQLKVENLTLLLKQFYDNVYVPSFPNASERQPFQYWLDRLNDKPTPASGIGIEQITVQGSCLGDAFLSAPKADGVVGRIAALKLDIYFPESQTALTHYAVKDMSITEPTKVNIAPLIRAQMQALTEVAARHNGSLKGVFGECDDPKKVDPAQSVIPPLTRLTLFQRLWGGRVINIDGERPYIQAEINPNCPICENLLLLTVPIADGSRCEDPAVLKEHLEQYYNYFARIMDLPNILDSDKGKALMTRVGELIDNPQEFYHPAYTKDLPKGVVQGNKIVLFEPVIGLDMDVVQAKG